MKKSWVRAKLAFRQNRLAIAFVVLWLGANAALFGRSMQRMQALATALCIDKVDGTWGHLYQSFTEVIVFGLIASMVVANVTRRYRPEETCRALASSMRGHTVVIGFTNLGKRIADLSPKVVVVDVDREAVNALIQGEEPLVIGSAQDREVLEQAAVAHAKVVVIATDDLETAAVAARHVRDLNADCELVIRCPDDDVGAVLARTYRAKAISTSKIAAIWVLAQAIRERRRSVMIVGKNNVGKRVAEALEQKRIPHSLVDLTDEAPAGVENADLVVMCDDDLGKNLVRIDRIRDRVKPGTRILCRAFHEEAAEVLKRPPLDCAVFSSSRLAAESLARSGVFGDVSVVVAPAVVQTAR